MFAKFVHRSPRPTTFMGRLRRDVRGNTLAIMAAALIPMAALAGSAIDMARLYVVKVRLQQACDAGALAGRKFMATSNDTTLDSVASGQATTFFNNNFRKGWMGTKTAVFTPSKTADQQVAGVATSIVPMTIMKMFAAPDITLNVTCEARYDVADADVMFVLDTTGSMACTTSDGLLGCSQAVGNYTRPDGTTGYYVTEKSGSKLSGLRSAVLNFYDTLAGNVDPSTNIRYGFVTYTSTVNAGYAVTALSPGYMVKSWRYQTRRIVGDNILKTNSSSTVAATSAADCQSKYSRSPATYSANDSEGTAYTVYPFNTSGTATAVDPVWTAASGSTAASCKLNNDTITPIWRYGQWPYDVSQYTSGTQASPVQVTDPSKVTGAKAPWQGCIEERNTTASASTFDQTNLPPDLDPDLKPTSDATRWRPMWSDVVYYRGNNTTVDSTGNSSNPYGDSTSTSQAGSQTNMLIYNNIGLGFVSCGKPVQRLTTMSRSDVSNYLNASDFKAQGGTYHDTGMIWGTRMISPSGIFAGDTAPWPGHQAPNRYIVFMTDGDMSPNSNIYGMYGLERYDQRVSGSTPANDEDNHNARFVAECSAAKARNITVFVVGFGQTLTDQLTACASPGQAYFASDNASLQAAFKTIANQVAMLRVSK